jgi:hypothetical protein
MGASVSADHEKIVRETIERCAQVADKHRREFEASQRRVMGTDLDRENAHGVGIGACLEIARDIRALAAPAPGAGEGPAHCRCVKCLRATPPTEGKAPDPRGCAVHGDWFNTCCRDLTAERARSAALERERDEALRHKSWHYQRGDEAEKRAEAAESRSAALLETLRVARNLVDGALATINRAVGTK